MSFKERKLAKQQQAKASKEKYAISEEKEGEIKELYKDDVQKMQDKTDEMVVKQQIEDMYIDRDFKDL